MRHTECNTYCVPLRINLGRWWTIPTVRAALDILFNQVSMVLLGHIAKDIRASSPASSFSFWSTSANDDWVCEPEGSSFLLFWAGSDVRPSVIVLGRFSAVIIFLVNDTHFSLAKGMFSLKEGEGESMSIGSRLIDRRGELKSASRSCALVCPVM